MTTPDIDTFQTELESVTSNLRNWAATEESDSVRVQRMRAGDIDSCSERMEKLVTTLPKDRVLLLTIGDTAIDASVFHKRPYDFYDESYREVLPTESVELCHVSHMSGERYFGNYMLEFTVSSLAKALQDRATIRISSKEEASKLDLGTGIRD